MNKLGKKRIDKVLLGFVGPALIFYLAFIVVPTVGSLYYSFTSWDGISPNIKFIGLGNYKEIFTSARFGNALKNTIVLTVFISVFENAIALALALLVDRVIKFSNLFRSLFYIPVLISGIVSGFIWKVMYNYNFGVINALLDNIGLAALKQDWLGNTNLTLIMIGVVLVWKGAGYYMIIYLASLQSISADILEAAEIDGASRKRIFWSVILPYITPVVFFNLMTNLVTAFQEFNSPFVITAGGPYESTYLMSMMIYENAFRYLNMGLSSAISLILFVIIVSFTLILFGSSRYWVNYQD